MSWVPVLIGKNTYGRYYETSCHFECSHGGWGSEITVTNREGEWYCTLQQVERNNKVFTLTFLDKIPDEYNYT